jgi:hypothetical protein
MDKQEFKEILELRATLEFKAIRVSEEIPGSKAIQEIKAILVLRVTRASRATPAFKEIQERVFKVPRVFKGSLVFMDKPESKETQAIRATREIRAILAFKA